VLDKCKLFHTDSIFCGISALALRTNAPSILKQEALDSTSKNTRGKKGYSKTLGNDQYVLAEKAIVANCSAVREWDSNGTVFGYNKNIPGH